MDESMNEPRPITVPEAMDMALQCLKNGRFQDGEVLCLKILEVAPDHPDATHYAGVLAHENGRGEQALALIRRSLELAPDRPDWHSNLGVVLQERGELDAATAAYRRAIELRPAHANAHGNLGVLLRAQGKLADAESAYRHAIEIDPRHADAHYNLAVLLSATNRTSEAVGCLRRALTLKPRYPQARQELARAYCRLGQRDKAVVVCEQWLRDDPESPVARHTLAACSGRDVPPRASDEYVREIFDGFASSFEAKLTKLSYRAPMLVAGALAASGLRADRALDVLDAGCGTGLCGPLIAKYARRLVGVDLSAGMLNHARRKGVYGELVQTELTAYLEQHHERFDVIVTADTLVYFGGLESVTRAAAGALRPGGVLVFTVEEANEPGQAGSYALQPHGRYTHGAEYVERLLLEAGLRPHIERGDLRLESGVPVAGLIVSAAKPPRRARI